MTKTPVRLSSESLQDLPQEVSKPAYAREELTPGIVHIGVGNFHRAHQAWYLHRLMNGGLARDWAIIGAGVRPGDAVMREKLLSQDCLTTLIELHPDATSAEVCGAMIGFLPVEPDNASLIAQMAEPAIRIVSLTVTEGGYFVNPATGAFDPAHPDIAHDAENPARPCTAFGAIVAALRIRRDTGAGPFTVQSCDNLSGNGHITRDTVLGLARLSDPALADWIAAHCTFPNSMVDCIVPATGAAEIAAARAFGIEDAAPVTHENYRQWVIEDAFCAGRPDWDRVGATFTDDVHDYETMKIRILNAGHQVLANAGELLGLATIADCMADASVSAFWRKVEMEEIVPHVAAVPGMTPEAYVDLIESRFSNPAIRDTTRRVAFDGSSRHAGFVLPIIRDGLAAGSPICGLALVEALWARMCQGTREDGSRIEPNDPAWDRLKPRAEAARNSPGAWLDQAEIYGDLGTEGRFASGFEAWSSLIWDKGTRTALETYVATGRPL
ncbi:Multiple polyol-specific dehydrogenase [Roseibacterium elongatum DSM 19469]|uniref:Multiple polyol-specific dehydrogenase n=1 Tax=Roseicyclus elongatus DSM 19469 TaxID=1294273 RepID=W8RZ53_9RHOB|nr:mannitol dehydrogenase family protein [Roseibacterium elongatum]AHM03152.1 Multiple polyol-specific dehydrogenase [Roseibacterium elongatum DSM 19469]